MSLTVDGFWKAGFWNQSFWADGFWEEGVITPTPTIIYGSRKKKIINEEELLILALLPIITGKWRN